MVTIEQGVILHNTGNAFVCVFLKINRINYVSFVLIINNKIIKVTISSYSKAYTYIFYLHPF